MSTLGQQTHSGSTNFTAPPMDDFRVVWTVGFAGKRKLLKPVEARNALRSELEALVAAAEKERALLVSVSSAAIGSDLIFAEECSRADIPWRAVLPFEADEFLKDDFSLADKERFERCLDLAYRVEVAPLDVASVRAVDNSDKAREDAAFKRRNAYLDSTYRVIEESDVVLFIWDGVRGGRGGTADAWSYAEALKKPVWRWSPQTEHAQRHRWPGVTGQGRETKFLFHARLLPELFSAVASLPTGETVATDTPIQRAVRARFHQLDRYAVNEQTKTKFRLQYVLVFHLIATIAAGIAATYLHGREPDELWILWIIPLIPLVGWTKPVCALLAFLVERLLHHDKHQARWVDARVATEIFRSVLASWNFPKQPTKVFDVEDFPRFRRLIQSLIITRALDDPCVARQWTLETACADYVVERIDGQSKFFRRQQEKARRTDRIWHWVFFGATAYVIVGGAILACVHSRIIHWHEEDPVVQTLGCLIIIAPFLATFGVAMRSIHDSRRRVTRFEAMDHYLGKQKEAIEKARSVIARVRLIGATERMLVEEVHEWDSVTRHVSI